MLSPPPDRGFHYIYNNKTGSDMVLCSLLGQLNFLYSRLPAAVRGMSPRSSPKLGEERPNTRGRRKSSLYTWQPFLAFRTLLLYEYKRDMLLLVSFLVDSYVNITK